MTTVTVDNRRSDRSMTTSTYLPVWVLDPEDMV